MMAREMVFAILLLLFLGLTPCISRPVDHTKIINNLLSFEGNELTLITDSSQGFFDPSQINVPMKMFNIENAWNKLQTEGDTKCPVWNNLDYVFEPFYTKNSDYRHLTIVVYIQQEQIEKTMAVIDSTVLNCSHLLEPGLYNMDNRFLFLADEHENGTKFSQKIFKSSPHVVRHRHIAVAKRFLLQEDKYLMFGLNLGYNKNNGESSKLLYVWNAKAQPSNLEDGFYGKVTTNYNGHKFTYLSARIDMHTFFCEKERKNIDELIPGQDTKEYLKCGGYDMYQTDFAMKMFNFSWGAITTRGVVLAEFVNETQRWIGAMEDLIHYTADYLLLGLTQVNPANRIFHAPNSMLQNEFYDIVAPYPKQISKFYALVLPYGNKVWAFLLGSLVLMSVLFPLLSYLQRSIDQLLNKPPSMQERGISSWFSYSALIGENMREESVSYHALPIRVLVGVWLLGCLILSASYAGNLKGFLTNLGYEPKIETPEHVLESGLPYYWHNHGTKILLEKSQNAAVREIDRNALSFPAALSFDMTVEMLYKAYQGERILIELNVVHRAIYDALFVSPTGVQGLTKTKIDSLVTGQTLNAFHKISLLAANFAHMQQRAAAFGLREHWWNMGIEEFSAICEKLFEETNKDKVINLDAPPILSPFTLEDLQAAFYLLLLFLGIGIVLFTLEIYFSKTGKKP